MKKNNVVNFNELLSKMMYRAADEEERTVIQREFMKIVELSTMLNCAAGGFEREFFEGKAVRGQLGNIGNAVEYFGEVLDESAIFLSNYVKERIRKAMSSYAEEYEGTIVSLGSSVENFWRDTMRCAFIDSDYGNFFHDNMPGVIGDALTRVMFNGSDDLLDSSKIKIVAAVNKYNAKEKVRIESLQKMLSCGTNNGGSEKSGA